jgi:hypothetical protein
MTLAALPASRAFCMLVYAGNAEPEGAHGNPDQQCISQHQTSERYALAITRGFGQRMQDQGQRGGKGAGILAVHVEEKLLPSGPRAATASRASPDEPVSKCTGIETTHNTARYRDTLPRAACPPLPASHSMHALHKAANCGLLARKRERSRQPQCLPPNTQALASCCSAPPATSDVAAL